MAQKHPEGDRNFDGLGPRFQKNIYTTMKGRMRLEVLKRDFDEFLPKAPLRCLDVGAGQGQWAAHLLTLGHAVTLTDISQEMLQWSKNWIQHHEWWEGAKDRVDWCECAIQDIDKRFTEQFDLVNCHAVFEWLERPQEALGYLTSVMKPNAWLSVIFYNLDGLIFKNLLRGNYRKIQNSDYRGEKGSLTPINPIRLQDMHEWVRQSGLDIICQSGIRVFHDYILDPNVRSRNDDATVEMELQFSRQAPYRDLGRYVHLLLKKANR